MKFFKNPDGTLNAINIFVVVTVISFILLFLLLKNLIFREKIGNVGLDNTTTTTTVWKMCQGCTMSFKEDGITMEANTMEKVENIMNYKQITLSSVKFKSSDKNIVSIVNKDGFVWFKAGDEVGSAKVTAEYDDISISIEVNVKASKINSASFGQDNYYAYLNEKNKLDIKVSPKKAPLSLLELKVENPEIGEFDANNNFVGKSVGETRITLTNGEETQTAIVHVIKNKLVIKVKVDGAYTELESYEYPSNIDSYVELCVKFEDRENIGYTDTDIESSIINYGKIETTVSNEGAYTLDKNAYIFKAHVKLDQTLESDENYSVITFKLPDGSQSEIKITKK